VEEKRKMAVATASNATETFRRKKLAFFLLVLQIIFIVLFSIFAKYEDDPKFQTKTPKITSPTLYPAFQDTHLVVLVGFALLVTFLKRYAFSALGFHLLITALVLQWGIWVHEMILTRGQGVLLGFQTLLTGDFAVMTVLISFGAVLGKLSPLQLIVMALFEVIFCAINQYIGKLIFMAADSGFSMYTHMFGAYFGLAVSRMVWKQHHTDHPQESRTYTSDMFTMIGTLFLWVCFPGLNSAMAPMQMQQRAMVNTVMSLAAATLTTFFMTTFISKEQKFSVVHMQNAALAGGVGIGTVAHMMVKPYGAMLVGVVCAMIAVFGYTYIQPCLTKRMKVHDTRGVNNVHGLPGIVAAIVGIIVTAMATVENYGTAMYMVFPAMAPTNMTTDPAIHQLVRLGTMSYGLERTAASQAGMQALTFAVSLAIALVGGAITGLVLRVPIWDQMTAESVFDDRDYWSTSEEGMPMYTVYVPPPPPEEEEKKEGGEEAVELKQKVVTEEK
jgi:ammonium transporter Rh